MILPQIAKFSALTSFAIECYPAIIFPQTQKIPIRDRLLI